MVVSVGGARSPAEIITSSESEAVPPVAPPSAISPVEAITDASHSLLLLSNRKYLDLNNNGLLSYEEFSQRLHASEISAEDQTTLATIDQAAFDAVAQTDGQPDGQVDLRILSANNYLVNQIARYGNPVPSGFLLASLSASGQIADPNALTPEEQKMLADLAQKLCTSGFELLSADEKTVVQRAATNLLRLDSSLGGLAAATAPTPEQLSAGITTLTNRMGYELDRKPASSGVEPKNFDYQSLLGGGTGADQLSLFAYNSVANQVKAEAGSLGQTDQIGTIYMPYLKQEETQIGGLVGGTTGGAEKPLSAQQKTFVDEWTQTHGPLSADNMGQLTAALTEKFKPEAGWSFQTQKIPDPWVGQRENIGILQDQEHQAYREWNPDGTPKVISPSHRAQALNRELQAKQPAFVRAVTTLKYEKAWAIMDYLEGKEFDWKNDLVGDNGLQQLAGLTPDSPQWDQLAADRPDRAVPREERQKYIDDAKVAISPEQAGNLSALKALGDNADRYNKQDWQSWLDAQADVAPYAQSSQTPSAAQQDFSVAVSTLNKPSAWALMDLLEGSGFEMHNDLVGDIGLGKLAQRTPESPEWDQLPEDKAVPDKATRQAMIDAAKLIGSPEQTANREALRALGANPESYNRQDWQSWLDAQPAALYDLNHWLGRLSQGAGEILKPIHVDRDHLSKGLNILFDVLLGIGNAVHTGTHKPYYSDEQQFVVDQLRAQGRDPKALEKAMEEAHDEWVDAVIESSFMAAAGVAMAAIPGIGVSASIVSRAAATAARVGESALGATGRVVGGTVGTMVSVVDQATIGGLGNLFTTLGVKVTAAAKAAWDKFVQRAGEGADPQELTPLLATAREGPEFLETASQLTAEQTSQLQQLRSLEAQLKRASEAQAALAVPSKQLAPEPVPTAPTASPPSEIVPAEPSVATPKLPAEIPDEYLPEVKWNNQGETIGEVKVYGKSFGVVKTTEGQVLTGKFEQRHFAAYEPKANGKFQGFYYQAGNGRWYRGRLQGGADEGPANTAQAQVTLAGPGKEGAGSPGSVAAASKTPSTAQLAEQSQAKIQWQNEAKTRGIVILDDQSFDVIKTVDGEVLTGRIKRSSGWFKELAPSRKQFTDVRYFEAQDGSGWWREGSQPTAPLNVRQDPADIPGEGVPEVFPLTNLPKDRLAAIFEHLDPATRQALLSANHELRDILRLEVHDITVSGSDLQKSIAVFPNAERIEISGQVTPEQLALLANLKRIKHLDLSRVNLTSEHLDALNPLRSLSSIELNLRIGELPALAASGAVFSKVVRLKLTGEVTPEKLALLENAKNLKHLDLSECTLTSESVQQLARLKNLDSIDLSVNGNKLEALESPEQLLAKIDRLKLNGLVSPGQLDLLAKAKKLSHLDLSYCSGITNTRLPYLKKIKTLRSLDLTGCSAITNRGLKTLAAISGLTSLNLKWCWNITNPGLANLGRLKGLTALNLSHCENISNEGLAELGKFKSLTQLDLSGCSRIKNLGLASLVRLKELTSLNLSHCSEISNKGLAHVGKLANLTKLDLSDCRSISDAGLVNLGGLKGLTALDLSDCLQITNKGLQHLTLLSSLSILNLNRCMKITNQGLAHLSNLTGLTHLDLSGCWRINEKGHRSLTQKGLHVVG